MQLKLKKNGIYNSTIELNKITDLLSYVDDILQIVSGVKRTSEPVDETDSEIESEARRIGGKHGKPGVPSQSPTNLS